MAADPPFVDGEIPSSAKWKLAVRRSPTLNRAEVDVVSPPRPENRASYIDVDTVRRGLHEHATGCSGMTLIADETALLNSVPPQHSRSRVPSSAAHNAEDLAPLCFTERESLRNAKSAYIRLLLEILIRESLGSAEQPGRVVVRGTQLLYAINSV
jgi:hypothetical protein